jgi:phage shock protein A
MQNNGILTRLSRLLGGVFGLWVTRAEEAHPAATYENAIRGMLERHGSLKQATASLLVRRDSTEQRLVSQKVALGQVAADLESALRAGDDELALVLLQKQDGLEKDIGELDAELVAAAGDAEEAKAALVQVAAEVKKLRAEKHAMLAKLASAEARLRIQEQLDGLSVEADVQALEHVREHIERTLAAANLGRELNEPSLEGRLQALRARSSATRTQARLDELKARLGVLRALPPG